MNSVASNIPGKMQCTLWVPSQPMVSWNECDILTRGKIFLLDEADYNDVALLDLPAEFWRTGSDTQLTEQLVKQFESDLDW